MVLVVESTRKPVEVGDIFWDFRYEHKYIVTGWREPHKEGSSGKVYCVIEGNNPRDPSVGLEYYPGVLGLKFINKEER